jgi:hypothetical protein
VTTTDLTRFTPGEVLAIDDRWDGRVFAKAVVFLGIDRGLAVVAECTNYVNPLWTDIDGDRPHLRRAEWKPRRVRASTVQGTWAEHEAEVAAERAAIAAKRQAEEDYEADKLTAAYELVALLDKIPGVTAYAKHGGVHVGGGPDGLRAVAKVVAEALGVTA